jgi:hypothetical protein
MVQHQSSNTFSGLAQMTIHCMLEIRPMLHVTMSSSPTTINTVHFPPVPTASATVQPTCATPSGTITITTQSGVEYSVNGTCISPLIHLQDWLRELYFICQNLADPSCVTMSGSTTTINSIPPPPVVPTTASVTQPTCAVQSGSISVTAIRS